MAIAYLYFLQSSLKYYLLSKTVKSVFLYSKGKGNPTVIVDHSLGGIEGYFLIDALAEITQVCIYDRAGYGWSNKSKKSRCSKNIVTELDLLLTKANIKPPYILNCVAKLN